MGNGEVFARTTGTSARTQEGAVIPGGLVSGRVITADASRSKPSPPVNPGLISAQIAWVFAVLAELNAYPGRLNVGSCATPDRPSALTGAVNQDTHAMAQVGSV